MRSVGVGSRKHRRALAASVRKLAKRDHWGEWDLRTREISFHTLPHFKEAWTNNLFAVQLFEPLRSWARMMINRHDGGRIGWADLQRIKNELIGHSRIAIQVFPRARDLVDSANMYWLFIVPGEDEYWLDIATNNQGRSTIDRDLLDLANGKPSTSPAIRVLQAIAEREKK